jgi:S-adenosylmethionine-dependent methyltransferase
MRHHVGVENDGESVAATFARYQQTATGHMRMALAERNMTDMHALSQPRRVLDAGGGNGVNTDWLVEQGHAVTLLDSDPEMLEQARQRSEETSRRGQRHLVRGAIEELPDIVGDQQFDLIVCHHVLEYLQDPLRAVEEFHAVAADGGELSLITLNPVSEVIRAMVFGRDASLARSRLTDLAYDAKWFGDARLYDLEQILEWGAQSRWSLQDFRAIRVLADYIPDDEYSESTLLATMALEESLAGLEPYRRMGRYLQFCFRKDIAPSAAS